MGQLPTQRILDSIRSFFSLVGEILKRLWCYISLAYSATRNWLRVHVPFIEALVQRHLRNPATVFVDIALFILALYLIFGVTGYDLVYHKKSETRFTETLTILYPLPAAKVNGSIIWSHRFLQRLRFLNTFDKNAPKDITANLPTDKELRQKIMDGLVEDKIIYLEAQKRGISVNETELNDAYNQQKKQTDNFDQKINQLYGMSPEEFKSVLAEQLLKEKVKAVVLTRIRVRHILVTTPSAAADAENQLKSGKDFAAVAKDFSQDAQTKDNGGDLGYWTKGGLAEQIGQDFENAAFSLDVNQISDPIQSKYGLHIIQVTEKTGNNTQSYSDWYNVTVKNYKITRYIDP